MVPHMCILKLYVGLALADLREGLHFSQPLINLTMLTSFQLILLKTLFRQNKYLEFLSMKKNAQF